MFAERAKGWRVLQLIYNSGKCVLRSGHATNPRKFFRGEEKKGLYTHTEADLS